MKIGVRLCIALKHKCLSGQNLARNHSGKNSRHEPQGVEHEKFAVVTTHDDWFNHLPLCHDGNVSRGL